MAVSKRVQTTHEWAMSGPHNAKVTVSGGCVVWLSIGGGHVRQFCDSLKPDEARELAASLVAAADEAEKQRSTE